MEGDPKKSGLPKKGSSVRLGIGNTRIVAAVDSISGKVHLRNPRNGMITTASARKVGEFQAGKKIKFTETKIK